MKDVSAVRGPFCPASIKGRVKERRLLIIFLSGRENRVVGKSAEVHVKETGRVELIY